MLLSEKREFQEDGPEGTFLRNKIHLDVSRNKSRVLRTTVGVGLMSQRQVEALCLPALCSKYDVMLWDSELRGMCDLIYISGRLL